MTPAFGFSVGDFISTINLIRKISKALKESGGASSEYQDAVVELKGLEHALQHLEALEPTEDNVGHVNAIRGMALACKIPLQEFMKKLETYEESLGPWAHRSSFSDFGRKTTWAVSFGKEIEKLRAVVAAKQISINLLLATHCSQTLSSLDNRTKQEYNASKARDEEHRTATVQVQSAVEGLGDRISIVATAAAAGMETLSDKVDATNSSVYSLRAVGDQIMNFVRTFPKEIRDRLQAITQADWRTYQAVLHIQEQIAQTPSSLHETNIQFTNVLGEHRSLPFEYFCHWETFEGFLRAQFKNKPGESKVLNGSFHIIDSNRRAIVNKNHWNKAVSSGTHLTMSMIMMHLRRNAEQCPQPDCVGIGLVCRKDPNQLTCDTCSLVFYQQTDHLEDTLNHIIVSEEDVTRQQVEEDMKLYGARLRPFDVDVAYGDTQSFKPPPKRDPPHLDAATTDRPIKLRNTFEYKDPKHQTLTAVDWNNGTSPMEAWLNQSAIPSIAPRKNDEEPILTSLAAQELEEVKVFRSVHVMATPSSAYLKDNLNVDGEFAALRSGAQIYHRNIKDKFPQIKPYLARRLAEANLDRAQVLQRNKDARLEAEQSHDRKPELLTQVIKYPERSLFPMPRDTSDTVANTHLRDQQDSDLEVLPPSRPSTLPTQDLATKKPLMEPMANAKVNTSAATTAYQPPTTSRNTSHDKDPREDCQYHSKNPLAGDKGLKCQAAKMLDFGVSERWPTGLCARKWEELHPRRRSSVVDSDHEGFWNGGPPSRRPSSPASVNSRSSSMNSLLRGSSKLDPREQDDDISRFSPSSPRGLPPPPVDLNKQTIFDCDLCGELVQAKRRLEWQKHVMSDLRPYLCTHEECMQSATTYVSRKEFTTHELRAHHFSRKDSKTSSNNDLCPFCQVNLPEPWQRNRGRHLGRHMEEVAFAVVPKPYEDWEFYSDSSESPVEEKVLLKCERINPGTGKPCNTMFSRAYDLTRHEDTIHKNRRSKRRCDHYVKKRTFSRKHALTRHIRVVHSDVDFIGKRRQTRN
ncbi:MAG: hypothetical protein Q9170_002485 [Blastenia crenularia]